MLTQYLAEVCFMTIFRQFTFNILEILVNEVSSSKGLEGDK